MLSLRLPVSRHRPSLLVLALLSAFAPSYSHADDAFDASVSVGVGVGDHGRADRAQFDQYSGLRPNDSVSGIFGAEYYRRNEDKGTVAGFKVSDLLQGNRELGLRYSRTGDWKVSVEYRELVRREPLTVNSGAAGVGSSALALNTTSAGTGSDVDLRVQRSALGVNVSKVLSPRMQVELSARTEHKEGARLFGIGMACPSLVAKDCTGTNGAQVGSAVLFAPEPIDADHHQLEARIGYAAEKVRLSVGYYGSFYRNALGSLTVGVPGTLLNPIGSPLPISSRLGTLLGQPIALAPDNEAHQVDVSGVWLASQKTQVNFKLARSRASQSDNFAGNGLAGAPAGVTDLGGRVDTTLAQVGFTSRLSPKVSLTGNVRFEDRDDSTPIALYNVVDTATFTNRQLPYRTLRSKLQGSYQINPDWKAGLGVTQDSVDRGDFTRTSAANGITALRRKTDDTTWRAEARRRLSEDFSGALSLEHSERTGSAWLADNSGRGVREVPDPGAAGTGFDRGIFMPNLADRNRDKVRFLGDWQPAEKLSLQAAVDYGRDHFHAPGVYGLRSSGVWQASVDASYALSGDWNLTGYLSQGIEGLEQGRPDAAFVSSRTRSMNVALGANGQVTSKIEVGATLGLSQDRSSFGQVLDSTASLANDALLKASGGLPGITYRQHALRLFGKYAIDKQSSIRGEVAHYRTRWSDWAWGADGTPFLFSDGTVVQRKLVQRISVVRVIYTYRWQ